MNKYGNQDQGEADHRTCRDPITVILRLNLIELDIPELPFGELNTGRPIKHLSWELSQNSEGFRQWIYVPMAYAKYGLKAVMTEVV